MRPRGGGEGKVHGRSLPEPCDILRAVYGGGVTDPTSLPSFPPPEDEHPLRGRVLDALLDEGYRPDVDEDGDVAVRIQGQQLFVRCMDTLPPLMRVFGQWVIGDDVPGDELLRLQAANAVTGTLNLVKATVFDERLVIADSLDLRALLTATLDAVLGSVQTWHSTVLELAEGLPPSM